MAFREQTPASISSPAPRPGQSSPASMGMRGWGRTQGGGGQGSTWTKEDHRSSPPSPNPGARELVLAQGGGYQSPGYAKICLMCM